MYTIYHVKQLRTGHCYEVFGGFGGHREGLHPWDPGYADAREAWQIFRDEIIRDWLDEEGPSWRPQGPGTRPWAWWAFDAPEPYRRRIDGGMHPFENPARQAYIQACEAEHPGSARSAMKCTFGLPSVLMRGDGFDDFEWAEYEHEFEYIDRLNLWLPGELALGVPRLATVIAKMRAEYTRADKEPTSEELDALRRLDAELARLTAKLEAEQ